MGKSPIIVRPLALICILVASLSLGCSDFDRLKLRARMGGADSQLLVGHRYETGKGVEQDPRAALHWYRKAAAQGHPNAFGVIGRLYAVGFGVNRDLVKANMYFQLGYRRGEEHLEPLIEKVEHELKAAEIKRSIRLADAWDSEH